MESFRPCPTTPTPADPSWALCRSAVAAQSLSLQQRSTCTRTDSASLSAMGAAAAMVFFFYKKGTMATKKQKKAKRRSLPLSSLETVF